MIIMVMIVYVVCYHFYNTFAYADIRVMKPGATLSDCLVDFEMLPLLLPFPMSVFSCF